MVVLGAMLVPRRLMPPLVVLVVVVLPLSLLSHLKRSWTPR
jgi:hypothetical protein